MWAPIAVFLMLLASPAMAYEYSGRVTAGAYQSKETFATPQNGSTSNDSRAVLGRMFLDVTEIGSLKHQFVFDFRDKYDFYAVTDQEHLLLTAANQPQLRQLAWKNPKNQGNFSWSLGRFPVIEAGVSANDGVEVGRRLAPGWHLGLFGGLIPNHRSGKTFSLNQNEREAGAYLVLQKSANDWQRHTYMAHSLVFEQTGEEYSDTNVTRPENTLTVADSSETSEPVNKLRWFSNTIYQLGPHTRITELASIYILPKIYIRNGYVSIFRQVEKNLSATLSLLRLDLTEYTQKRDIRDALAPSAYTQTQLRSNYKISKNLTLIGDARYGVRSADSLNKFEVSGGVLGSQLLKNHLIASLKAGYRKNFVSKDTFIRASFEYFVNRLELSFTQDVINEQHDNGETLHPMISTLTSGYLMTNELLGSASLEYARDEKVTIMSGLLTLGYRFNSKQLTPVRRDAPPIARL